jgi:leader peptidase (prepilin peptidase)/N-methyltransferase
MPTTSASSIILAGAMILGLVAGSFLHAWAWRRARGRRITRGFSACPVCGLRLTARDLVPLVSWLLLQGRCRSCGAAISWRYPLTEAITAALFVAVAAHDGLSPVLAPHLLFVAVLVLVSATDLEEGVVPDAVVLPASAAGLPLMILLSDGRWWQWPLAGLAAAAALFAVAATYRHVRGRDGLGAGDVKLALCLGVYLGVAVLPALFFGFLLGAVAGLGLLLSGRADGHSSLPFAPFLAAGAVVALLAGREALTAYLVLLSP